ncbi:MAG TPA: cysteine hydrolase [Sphingomonadaceae bacterium]|jgi:ureidoacrylate peracid hydrolase|nr:cysteine hydrolase [Sphingomonadaceae bacterium]
MHQIDIAPELIAQRNQARGGRRSIFGDIVPERTAQVVIDMQNGFMEPGAPVEVPFAREIVPHVNAIGEALRKAGGTNIFVRFSTPVDALESWSNFYARLPVEARQAHQAAFAPGAHYWEFWPELDIRDEDVIVEKGRFSAFVPGTCDLDETLRARGIDTLIVTGTLTNCCCESTARDAMQRNYKVLFVEDANAARSDADHNAALANMCALFADVMPTDELLSALRG